MNAAQIAALADLHRVPSWELQRCLPDIAERMASQIMELHREPTPERAERLCIELEGTRRQISRIREALVREATGPDA